MGKKTGRKPRAIALYKGDEFIGIGTYKELARKIGIKEVSLRFATTPTHNKRATNYNNQYFKVELDDE